MYDDNSKLADLLFPKPLPSITELAEKFPGRTLPASAMVTRMAPSPTGFMHIGTVYTALINYRLARQSEGVFFLRLEDTDKKREVQGAAELVIESLEKFGIVADEGAALNGEKGAYGPYTQSQRAEIYQAYARQLVTEGKAYACFCSPEELEGISAKQSAMKLKPGYYKQWAVWRNKSLAEVEQALAAGQKPVIRLRNEGNSARRFKVEDLIKGKLELPEEDADTVLLKSDGLPTYHFAHIIDDHLMGTTHVIRGDEWFASLPLHLQLFKVMGWTAPQYAHIAPIQKLDEGNRRKLSKRKDPEASVSYYFEQGYPVPSIIDYLMTVADSGFEPWRRQNSMAPLSDYQLKIKSIGSSGALLDFKKLDNISTNVIGNMQPEQSYQLALEWATTYAPDLAALMGDKEYWLQILSMDKDNPNQRKDLAKWSQALEYYGFFFDQIYQGLKWDLAALLPHIPTDIGQSARQKFLETYQADDSKEVWLDKIKQIAVSLGFAPEVKLFKENPGQYRGHFGDITQILRVILTGRAQSPDLYAIMRVLGEARVRQRLS